MVVDATRKRRAGGLRRLPFKRGFERQVAALRSVDRRIIDVNLVHDTLLLVKVRRDGMQVLKNLVGRKELAHVAMIAAVSDDVDIRNREHYLWGIFTRFDCERDLVFTEQRMMGVSPIYGGAMGIDATWKRGYPEPLSMTEDIRKRVDERWDAYWR